MTTLLFLAGFTMTIAGVADSFLVEDRGLLHIAMSMAVKIVGLACLYTAAILMVQQIGGE